MVLLSAYGIFDSAVYTYRGVLSIANWFYKTERIARDVKCVAIHRAIVYTVGDGFRVAYMLYSGGCVFDGCLGNGCLAGIRG